MKKARTTKGTIEKVEKIVRDALAERFKEGFVFDPIIVEPWFDYVTDEEYLHVYVVYEGDYDALDPSWTGSLGLLIRERTTEDEVWTAPGKAFVPKDEWEEYFAKDYRERPA